MFLLANGAVAENTVTIAVLCAVIVFLSIFNAVLVIALNRRNTKLVNSRLDLDKTEEERGTETGQAESRQDSDN